MLTPSQQEELSELRNGWFRRATFLVAGGCYTVEGWNVQPQKKKRKEAEKNIEGVSDDKSSKQLQQATEIRRSLEHALQEARQKQKQGTDTRASAPSEEDIQFLIRQQFPTMQRLARLTQEVTRPEGETGRDDLYIDDRMQNLSTGSEEESDQEDSQVEYESSDTHSESAHSAESHSRKVARAVSTLRGYRKKLLINARSEQQTWEKIDDVHFALPPAEEGKQYQQARKAPKPTSLIDFVARASKPVAKKRSTMKHPAKSKDTIDLSSIRSHVLAVQQQLLQESPPPSKRDSKRTKKWKRSQEYSDDDDEDYIEDIHVKRDRPSRRRRIYRLPRRNRERPNGPPREVVYRSPLPTVVPEDPLSFSRMPASGISESRRHQSRKRASTEEKPPKRKSSRPKHNLFLSTASPDVSSASSSSEDLYIPPMDQAVSELPIRRSRRATGPRKCHSCKKMSHHTLKCQFFLATGCRCGKHYCMECISSIPEYSEQWDPADTNEWHCPSCLGTCKCASCLLQRKKAAAYSSTRGRQQPRRR